MHNTDIRAEAKKNCVFIYEIADKLGISEPTMTRMLRRELTQERKNVIIRAISEIAASRPSKN